MDKRFVVDMLLLVSIGLLAACGATTPEISPLATPPLDSPLATPAPAGIRPAGPDTCSEASRVMRDVVGMDGTTGEAQFQDYINGREGIGCQVTVTGTGADFWRVGPIAGALKTALQAEGWTEDMAYAADGPTGTAAAVRRDADLCLLSVSWKPSADANCPQDQPISACNLEPEQQLYTITLNCARVGD